MGVYDGIKANVNLRHRTNLGGSNTFSSVNEQNSSSAKTSRRDEWKESFLQRQAYSKKLYFDHLLQTLGLLTIRANVGCDKKFFCVIRYFSGTIPEKNHQYGFRRYLRLEYRTWKRIGKFPLAEGVCDASEAVKMFSQLHIRALGAQSMRVITPRRATGFFLNII